MQIRRKRGMQQDCFVPRNDGGGQQALGETNYDADLTSLHTEVKSTCFFCVREACGMVEICKKAVLRDSERERF